VKTNFAAEISIVSPICWCAALTSAITNAALRAKKRVCLTGLAGYHSAARSAEEFNRLGSFGVV
jgi:hypothetical protein